MAALPRFVLDFVPTPPATGEPIRVDLTEALVGRGVSAFRSADRTDELVVPGLDLLSCWLPHEVRRAVADGSLACGDFDAAADAFVGAVPTRSDALVLRDALRYEQRIGRELSEAREKVELLRAARWESDARVFEWVHDQSGPSSWHDGYARTEDALGDAIGSAFGTVADRWAFSAGNLRERVAEALEIDGGSGEEPIVADTMVGDIIEADMQDHHEDARDGVLDEEALVAIVAEWLPHAGDGSPADRALDERVAAWNGRQNVVSYMADTAVAVPLLPGLDRDGAIALAEGRVADLERAHAAAGNVWNRGPAQAASPSP